MTRWRWLLLVACACTPTSANPAAIDCERPSEGCACPNEGAVIPCYADPVRGDGGVECHAGQRGCFDGVWGACEDLHPVELPEDAVASVEAALITGPDTCNVCNPNCFRSNDTPTSGDLTPENSSGLAYDPNTGGVRPAPTGPGSTVTVGHGPASGDPFDLDGGEAEGLAISPTGALILSSDREGDDYIWIANTSEGTISRFDIRTFAEVGRFFVGPAGTNNDPSRTSINSAGDAFVAGRRGNFLTRISTRGMDCPDTNGDGVITTSLNGVALPWGQDDCVLWITPLWPNPVFPNAWVRAVAAQDLVDPVTGDIREFVWVGGYSDQRVAMLDGATGAVLLVTNAGVTPYGMALDRAQNLWITGGWENRRIVRINTNLCNPVAGCPTTICDGESAACDAAAKQRLTTPLSNGYGITVDFNQRVWLGGSPRVHRYTHAAPIGSRWATVPWSAPNYQAGIAADSRGNVWTTGAFGVLRIDANNPNNYHVIPYRTSNPNRSLARGWGVAIDAEDKAWVIGRWDNRAFVYTPGAALNSATMVTTATSIRDPYTYSDMTGVQLRLASSARGTYNQVFEGCAGGLPDWENLNFDATIPPGTLVAFRVRTADTRAELGAATWVGVGIAPPGTSPMNVRTRMLAAGITSRRFAEVEVNLISTVNTPSTFVTPEVRGFGLTHQCITPTVGRYQRTYDANATCTIPPDRPIWGQLSYNTQTPDDSRITFNIRTAETLAGIAAATPVAVNVPAAPDVGSVDVRTLLQMAGVLSDLPFLQVEAVLTSGLVARPTLTSFGLEFECVPME